MLLNDPFERISCSTNSFCKYYEFKLYYFKLAQELWYIVIFAITYVLTKDFNVFVTLLLYSSPGEE